MGHVATDFMADTDARADAWTKKMRLRPLKGRNARWATTHRYLTVTSIRIDPGDIGATSDAMAHKAIMIAADRHTTTDWWLRHHGDDATHAIITEARRHVPSLRRMRDDTYTY